MVFGDFGEYLTVQLDVRGLELRNEAGIGEAVFAGGSVQLESPEAPEIPLLLLAVTEHVRPRVKERFLGGSVVTLATPHETLRVPEQTFTAGVCSCTSFDAGHGL